MINQFKFTCYMFQAMTEKGQGGYGSSKDDAPKATTTQQKQNK